METIHLRRSGRGAQGNRADSGGQLCAPRALCRALHTRPQAPFGDKRLLSPRCRRGNETLKAYNAALDHSAPSILSGRLFSGASGKPEGKSLGKVGG